MNIEKALKVSETIRDHLTKQRAISGTTDPDTGKAYCKYRGENGAMCAVGCLIKEEYYSRGMEGDGCLSGRVQKVLTWSLGEEPDELMNAVLYRWQSYHDDASSPSTGRPHYSYGGWTKGLATEQSPENFHHEIVAIVTQGVGA